jgi:hypothetical protein
LALSEVRTQNGPYLVAGLLANRLGGPTVFDRLAERFDAALERFPVNSHSRMLGGVRMLCGDRALAERVTGFLAAHPLRSGQRTVDQTVERLWINVEFLERESSRLAATLRRGPGSSDT